MAYGVLQLLPFKHIVVGMLMRALVVLLQQGQVLMSTVLLATKDHCTVLSDYRGENFLLPIVVMQLLTQFVSITGTQYESVYSVFLKWLNVINLDMSWLLSAGCVLRVSFYVKLLTATIAPECAISTVVFQTFSCDYLEDTKESWLRADYSVSCDTDKHTAYKVYAAVMIAVYPIGIPVLYATLLWRHRHSLNLTASITAEATGLRALPRSHLEISVVHSKRLPFVPPK
eukprot:21161-Heterococcus_DN1.PRE.3